MNKLLGLITVTLFAVNSFTGIAKASTMHAYASEKIQKNLELRSTLESMGYTAETAADAFAKAADELEAQGVKTNLGTLALCAEATGRGLIIKASAVICSTLFNSYYVLTAGIATGTITDKSGDMFASGAVTLDAIYFRTEDGNSVANKKHCFGGAEVMITPTIAGYTYGGTAAAEIDCDASHEGKLIFRKGFLATIKFGVGLGSNYGVSKIEVKHLATY